MNRSRAYNDGFDYAAGELLRNYKDDYDALCRPGTSERLLQESEGSVEYSDFDRGIRAALVIWSEKVYIKS